jgi:WD40 repeat protein
MSADLDPEDIDSIPGAGRGRRLVASGWTRIARVSWELRLMVIAVPAVAALIWSNSQGPRSSSGDRVALTGHTRLVEAVTFSPDGQALASCGFDHTVRLWDAARLDDEQLAEPEVLSHPSVIYTTAFSSDGLRLAAAGDRTVTIWARKPTYHREEERSGETYHSLAFSPDGRTLALAAEDGTIRLWEIPGARERAVIRGHSDIVRSVAFSPDGTVLASGGQDGRVVLWDAIRQTELRTLIEKGTSPVRQLAFSPDGRSIAVAEPTYKEKEVLVFDAETGAIRTRLGHHPLGITALAFSPDGRLLATTGVDHTLRVWDLAAAKELAGVKEENWLKSTAFSPDGRWLAYAGGDETVRLLDLRRRQLAPPSISRPVAQADRKST